MSAPDVVRVEDMPSEIIREDVPAHVQDMPSWRAYTHGWNSAVMAARARFPAAAASGSDQALTRTLRALAGQLDGIQDLTRQAATQLVELSDAVDPERCAADLRAALGSSGVRQCRLCGCTDENCAQCVIRTGEPCSWVEPDLCSACPSSAVTMDGRAGVPTEPQERYGVANGYLFEYVNHHTCGTGPNGHYGAHEPGCGQESIGKVEDLLTTVASVPALRADLYEEIANGIRPGTHHCFKMTCWECAVRKEREERKQWLLNQAKVLRANVARVQL